MCCVEQPLVVIRVVVLSRVPSWLQVCLGGEGDEYILSFRTNIALESNREIKCCERTNMPTIGLYWCVCVVCVCEWGVWRDLLVSDRLQDF